MPPSDEQAEKEALRASLPQGLIDWRTQRNAECVRLGRKVLIDAIAPTDRGDQYVRVEIPADARYPSGTPIGEQAEDMGQAWHGRPDQFSSTSGPPAETVWEIQPAPYFGHSDPDGGITTGAWVLNIRTDLGPDSPNFNLYELRMERSTTMDFAIVVTFETGGDARSWGSEEVGEDLRTGEERLRHLKPILDPELLAARGAVVQGDLGSPS